MSAHYHAVAWIDHHEARIVFFNAEAAEESVLHPAHPPRHLHARVGSPSGTHLQGDPAFYREVAAALAEAGEFLIVGPSSAKAELVKHLHKEAPQLMERLVGVETLPALSDAQLVAEARRYVKAADRLRPQRG